MQRYEQGCDSYKYMDTRVSVAIRETMLELQPHRDEMKNSNLPPGAHAVKLALLYREVGWSLTEGMFR